MLRHAIVGLSLLPFSVVPALADNLEVGPGKPFATIESALSKVKAGDTILVHPRPGNAPYEKVAARVRIPKITIQSAAPEGSPRVKFSGEGYDYSGSGAVPRAIVQFDPGAHHGRLVGFELFGAKNQSHNGAGVRINGPNGVTIENCEIHDNQMGIMSGGDGTPSTAADQLITRCEIHHNGAPEDPGYNHNLYLGGTSVRVSGCDIHHSLTGHNFKSRAHFNWVEYSYIHDSANREFDLVDAKDTERPGSDTVLLGNIIVKNPETKGNRTVIHFGKDGGKRHDGVIHLIHNTIATPFIAPVVELSDDAHAGGFHDNIVWDFNANQRNQVLARSPGGPLPALEGDGNVVGPNFTIPQGTSPHFLAANVDRRKLGEWLPNRDALLKPPAAAIGSGAAVSQLRLPAFPGEGEECCVLEPLVSQYRHPAGREPRNDASAPARGPFARP